MRVPSEAISEPWTDSLSIRIQLPLSSHGDAITEATIEDELLLDELTFLQSTLKHFTRTTRSSLMALRSLHRNEPLVLFTPYLQPAGCRNAGTGNSQSGDPFEIFGRQLAKHHPNICHVPYVASVGFTQTHLDFVIDSVAVITVVCEPEDHPLKKVSMGQQHDFAQAALKAFEAKAGTEEDGSHEFVLVQCAAGKARRRASSGFTNVIETDTYDDNVAVYLADTILGRI